MGHYQNFKTVVYCTAGEMSRVTEDELREQIDFFQKYVGVDKVYVEPFRGEAFVEREQLHRVKRVFKEAGIEIAGGITTVVPDLLPEDAKRQRLFETFCYTAPHMREKLTQVVEYIASEFDEFIIDDFYFTNCTCDRCRAAKGDRSWEEFRLALMREVSESCVLGPARRVNPRIRVTIKYPNWMEAYQETGYNPKEQKDLFEMIYTGTENRHPRHTNQHLPRYRSYSLMRYMEETAPGRNGGGWFDPFQCYPMDCYLEQMYLTTFAKAREVMFFCWAALYKNKLVTPAGFQLARLDALMGRTGRCTGVPVYLPHNAQGEDFLEDYLGMCGIPLYGTPDFPADAPVLMLTAAALSDADILGKLEPYVAGGGKAIVSGGFMRGALASGIGIEQMTSLRDRGRRFTADEYMVETPGQLYNCRYVRAHAQAGYSLLENRNNATWCIICAMHGDENFGILTEDTYGEGKLMTLIAPDNFADIKHLPVEALTRIRREFGLYAYLEAPAQISMFLYENEVLALESYTADFCQPEIIRVHVRGEAKKLVHLEKGRETLPLYTKNGESVFEVATLPGEFDFYRIER